MISYVEPKKRVLAVDDEKPILRFINAGLTAAGYEVVTTNSGDEALKLAKSQKFNVMLLDIVMLPTTGFHVLKALREFSQLPVITFTAKNNMIEEASKLGANGFIAKPFRCEDLVKKIEEVLSVPKLPQ